jgi:predicted O-methyltransferase YrrM
MWMKRDWLQKRVGQSPVMRQAAIRLLSGIELAAMGGHKQPAVLDVIRRSRREGESLLTANEAFMLHALARAQSALDGDMAELGVYQGSSAAIIAPASGDRIFHLFDTFDGLPEPGAAERAVLERGQFAADATIVRHRLRRWPNIRFHVGEFPASAAGLEDRRFSFVHLDVDLYQSTLAGLSFFYPRLVPGGVIISHDYSMLPGVERAFADFLEDKPERPIELPSTQAMIVRLPGEGAPA